MRLIVVMFLMAASAACQHVASGDEQSPATLTDAERGRLAFVQAACGGCHAVEVPGLSPNPASPPFGVIANRTELDRETLAAWLRDAHNYPEEMDFDLDPPQVQQIADYILTLRSEGYKRVPD